MLIIPVILWLYWADSSIVLKPETTSSEIPEKSATSQVVELPAVWGDLGAQMVATGIIDQVKFEALYAERGGLTDVEKQFLVGRVDGNIVVTQENSNFILNLFWALGLGNKNVILEKGQMSNPQFGGVGRFASTGGWSLAKGDPMKYYSAHPFITLTTGQQTLVERVSGNIYRPCCDNPTHFPDCNHGMAMLGFLELMAAQGVAEKEMYRAALVMNTLWFPDEYGILRAYFETQGALPDAVDPAVVLGASYSSASGFDRVQASLQQFEPAQGGSCSA